MLVKKKRKSQVNTLSVYYFLQRDSRDLTSLFLNLQIDLKDWRKSHLRITYSISPPKLSFYLTFCDIMFYCCFVLYISRVISVNSNLKVLLTREVFDKSSRFAGHRGSTLPVLENNDHRPLALMSLKPLVSPDCCLV